MIPLPHATRPHVIVADDSGEQRWLVHHMLEPLGFAVTEVEDGRSLFWALGHLIRTSETPNVVVIADVFMPVYNGLDVLAAWREVDWHSPFVVMTAFPDEGVIRRVRELDAILLAKPFTLFDLLKVARKLHLLSRSETTPWRA